MVATVDYIERRFDEFNKLMFGGRLPKLHIVLSDAKTFLGVCVVKSKILPNGLKQYYDYELRINTRIDLPEDVVEDTIIY